jgi:hypothetical protein
MAKNDRVTLVHESGFEESVPADDKVEIKQRLARGFKVKDEPKRAAATPSNRDAK